MPMKSKAQWRRMFAMEGRGEVPKGTSRRWASHTNRSYDDLPERKRKRKKHGNPHPDGGWRKQFKKC